MNIKGLNKTNPLIVSPDAKKEKAQDPYANLRKSTQAQKTWKKQRKINKKEPLALSVLRNRYHKHGQRPKHRKKANLLVLIWWREL